MLEPVVGVVLPEFVDVVERAVVVVPVPLRLVVPDTVVVVETVAVVVTDDVEVTVLVTTVVEVWQAQVDGSPPLVVVMSGA